MGDADDHSVHSHSTTGVWSRDQSHVCCGVGAHHGWFFIHQHNRVYQRMLLEQVMLNGSLHVYMYIDIQYRT